MAIRLWQKREVNAFCVKLVDAGYHVSGDAYKKECWNEGELVFSALNGRRNWLCRVNDKYISEEKHEIPCVV